MNELIFNGVNFTAFDAYYAKSNFLDGAAKDYTSVSVLGRSGDLQISNNRYKNITVKVRVYVRSNMEQNIRAMRSYLESVNGYARLELSDQPNEYRIGLYKEMFIPSSYDVNVGVVDLTFDCKPQRFLKSGEIPVSASSQSVSYTGNPVSIDNPSGISAVSSLAVALNPIQNLNGYDSPWVGGAEKNKLPTPYGDGVSKTTNGITYTVNADGSVTANGTATANNVFYLVSPSASALANKRIASGTYVLSGAPSTSTSSNYYIQAQINGDTWVTATASGATINYNATAGGTDLIRLYVVSGAVLNNVTFKPMLRLASVTDATYEPYENVCPITGHTSASVTRTGKNLLQINNNVTNTYTHNGVTYTFARDSQGNLLSITADGTATGGNSYVIISVFTNMQYLVGLGKPIKLSGAPNENGRARLQWWNYNGNGATAGDNGNGSSAFIPTSTAGNVAIQVSVNETVHNAVYKPMILLADETDRTYEPYQGNGYVINLNGERYGGTLDVSTGVLTLTHGFATFDGDEDWGLQGGGRRCGIGAHLPNYKVVEGNDRTIGALSNLFKEKNPSATWNSEIGFSIEANGTLVVRQFTTNTMTLADFKSFLQSNPMQICYPLQTPQTVQLTAQQISLLTGINYISSSDEVTVTVSEPSLLENPTLFESKPLIRVYGHGTLTVNNQYVTIAENPYEYIDIDCDIMDAFYGANNANQYVSLPNDYITLKSGNNYIAYDGTVQITPRWYEV